MTETGASSFARSVSVASTRRGFTAASSNTGGPHAIGPDARPLSSMNFFYVIEAYCPDPALRTPDSPFAADDAEFRASAEIALARLLADRPSGKLI